MKKLLVAAVVSGMLLGACGEGDSNDAETAAEESAAAATQAANQAQQQVQQLQQQVNQQQQQLRQEQSEPDPAPAPPPDPAPAPDPEPSEPPDVVGLTLPTAKQQLQAAGFRADVSNTDTTFGIILPENYTVCTQDDPVGNIVPILAQKYGC